MPVNALVLVIVAAFAHSTWNLIAKRAAASKHLIWFSSIAETLLFLPVAVWILRSPHSRLDWRAAVFLFATGLLHVLYFDALQQGYRVADLSVVYPLARGSGPLLAFVGAIVVLGERPSLVAWGGALMITTGIMLLTGFHSANRAGLFWGIATGVTIACYTLTDGYSVKVLLISPFLVEYAGCVFRLVALSRRGWRDRIELPREFRLYWKTALGIAVLLPAGYILVLFAMRIAPVSQVAPIREMSMVIAALFGKHLLGEAGRHRVAGAVLIGAGVAALAAG